MWQIKHSQDLFRDPVGAEKDMADERGESTVNTGPKSSVQDHKCIAPETEKGRSRGHKIGRTRNQGPIAVQAIAASPLWGKRSRPRELGSQRGINSLVV